MSLIDFSSAQLLTDLMLLSFNLIFWPNKI